MPPLITHCSVSLLLPFCLGENIPFNTLLSNTLGLCFSFGPISLYCNERIV